MSALLKLLDIIPGWIWAAMCAGLMATNCASLHQRDTARLELSDMKAMHAEAARAAEATARAKEQAAAQSLVQIEKEARDAQKTLSDQLAAVRRELRNRPQRPSGDVPTSTGSGLGCTGAQLHREDAEFLVRESARADGLRIALGRCQAAYDQAVKLTN